MMSGAKAKSEWQRLDLQLDRELEATFPASDALKVTRTQPDAFENTKRRKATKDRSLDYLETTKATT